MQFFPFIIFFQQILQKKEFNDPFVGLVLLTKNHLTNLHISGQICKEIGEFVNFPALKFEGDKFINLLTKEFY